MTTSYAGDVAPAATWAALEAEPDAVLIDVRTRAEWTYVGVPDLGPLDKILVRVEWQTWPDGQVNPEFVDEVRAAGVTPDHAVYLLCRSGVRSKAAAAALTAEGWPRAFNVLDGFEGPPDAARHRGTLGGWKTCGLPWVQG